MRRLASLMLLAGSALGLSGCGLRPTELSLQEREVGDALEVCLDRGLADLKISSVGAAFDGAVLKASPAAIRSLSRTGLREDLEADAWESAGQVVVALGIPKQMRPASTTPTGVQALSNQSAMIWEAAGTLDAVAGCLDELTTTSG